MCSCMLISWEEHNNYCVQFENYRSRVHVDLRIKEVNVSTPCAFP